MMGGKRSDAQVECAWKKPSALMLRFRQPIRPAGSGCRRVTVSFAGDCGEECFLNIMTEAEPTFWSTSWTTQLMRGE